MANAVVVGMAVVVGLLALLVVGLLRSHAEILRALHDLGVNLEDGNVAPDARRPATTAAVSTHGPRRTADGVSRPRGGDDAPLGEAFDLLGRLPGGGTARVAVLGVEHSTLIAFLSTGCGTCGIFWESLQDPDNHTIPGVATRIVIVTSGEEAESPSEVAERAPSDVVTLMSSEAWDDYNIPVSPYFVLVEGPTGRVIGEGAGTSWEQVRDLMARAVADAGVATTTAQSPTRLGGQDRAELVDRALHAAGIHPGDPSLYPDTDPSHDPANIEGRVP